MKYLGIDLVTAASFHSVLRTRLELLDREFKKCGEPIITDTVNVEAVLQVTVVCGDRCLYKAPLRLQPARKCSQRGRLIADVSRSTTCLLCRWERLWFSLDNDSLS